MIDVECGSMTFISRLTRQTAFSFKVVIVHCSRWESQFDLMSSRSPVSAMESQRDNFPNNSELKSRASALLKISLPTTESPTAVVGPEQTSVRLFSPGFPSM